MAVVLVAVGRVVVGVIVVGVVCVVGSGGSGDGCG